MQKYDFGDLNQLESEWITHILRLNGMANNSSVNGFSLETLSGYGGFTNSLYRLNLQYDVIENDTLTSMVVKTPSKNDLIRGVTDILQSNQREVDFYRHVPSVQKLRTPYIYYLDIAENKEDTIIFMQDMVGYTQGDSVLGCSLEYAKKFIKGIAGFHATFWSSENYGYIPLRKDQAQEYMALYPEAWCSILNKTGDFIPESLSTLGQDIFGHILTIKDTLSIYPATICHGDYRLDNIFFKNDELVVFDWEYCVRGRGVYDVATFITEAFNPIERKRWEFDLLKLYYSTLQENGISDYSFDDCFYDYSVSMLEIFVFWVVTGGYCDYNDGRSMAYLKNSMIRFDAAIADLDSLKRLRSI